MSKKKKAWSLSTLNLYESCPYKYKVIKIDKIPEPPSYHLTKGIRIHEEAEKFLLGQFGNELPDYLRKFNREFRNLVKHNAKPEEQWVLDSNWNFIEGEGAWFHPDVYIRMKIDARVDNVIIDFKTGKHYDEHVHQANLYATAFLNNFKDYDDVIVEFWHLDNGAVYEHQFYRKDVEEYINQWENRVSVLHNDTTFEPRKHQWCRTCFLKQECPAYK